MATFTYWAVVGGFVGLPVLAALIERRLGLALSLGVGGLLVTLGLPFVLLRGVGQSIVIGHDAPGIIVLPLLPPLLGFVWFSICTVIYAVRIMAKP